MKIVQYLARTRLEDGGVVRAVLDLCGALACRGHDVCLLTFDASDVPAPWRQGAREHPRVTCLRGPGPGGRAGRGAIAAARAEIGSADVIHLHVPWDPACVQLGRVARIAGVPYIVAIHGMLDDWSMRQKALKKRLFLAAVGRRFLEHAAAVHLTAQAECEQSARWYPRGRPVVLPLIFDVSGYRDLPGPDAARAKFAPAFGVDNLPVLLFVSRLHPKKRVDLLVEAAARLRDGGLNCRVVIAGTGDPSYESQLRRLARDLRLEDRVAFVGFVSGVEKVSLYQAADLFVLPTSQENWGFVLLESMAAATPVVTTRGVDIWPELAGSGGAVIVDQTAPAFADAVAGLLADGPRLDSMRSRARQWVLENLNTDTVIARYEALYSGVAGAARRG